MFNWSGTRRDLHLVGRKNPTTRTGKIDRIISFRVNDKGDLVPTETTADPFDQIVSVNDESEKAVITGIFLRFIQNDFALDNILVYLKRVFLPPDYLKYDELSIDNGTVQIPCFPTMHGYVDERDALIYKPVPTLDKVYQYAGLEDKIFKPSMREINMTDDNTEMVDPNMYAEDHPLVHFLATQDVFKVPKNDFRKILIEGHPYYVIAPLLVEKVQQYFKSDIFQHLHYTRFEKTTVETSLKGLKANDPRGIVILLQIDYLVVNKNAL